MIEMVGCPCDAECETDLRSCNNSMRSRVEGRCGRMNINVV